MSTPMYEYETEWEDELEMEDEWEGEDESEQFFGRLASLARRAGRSPALRRIGLSAARSALRGLSGVGGRIGGATGRQLGAQAANVLGGYLPQSEFEGEFEDEWETEIEGEVEMFASPSQVAQTAALMAHLGHAAAEAESEDESEAFLGALIPLAARLVPRVAPAIMRATPHLVRGISNVGRTLLNNPTTRPLIRALPTVARNTAASLARQVASGRQITPQIAVRTLAQQTANVLGNPRRAARAGRQARTLDRRYHRGGAGAGAGAGADIAAAGNGVAADAGSCQCGAQAMY
ncbi:MAG TPA: hypothetical protein VJM50_22875 [Pyrinomonadaceae bacterium]|nr:hypothetical protein [Pyrinomonadaceae bacterium]